MAGRTFKNLTPYVHHIVLYGDGIHDDTVALQALIDGKEVWDSQGYFLSALYSSLYGKIFRIMKTIHINKDCRDIGFENCLFTMDPSNYTDPVLTIDASVSFSPRFRGCIFHTF